MSLSTASQSARPPLFAPDGFGGWMGAPAVGALVRDRAAAAGIHLKLHPMGDGGEGSLEALLAHRPGQLLERRVTGPDGKPRGARMALLSAGAYFESATAIGRRGDWGDGDALSASSVALGQALRAFSTDWSGPLRLGLGGSATVDGGLGALIALGLVATDAAGRSISAEEGARGLLKLARIDGEPEALGRVELWADVRCPLLVSAQRYGPQKGLIPSDIAPITAGLGRLAEALDAWRGRRGRPPLPRDLPGGGAAGGLGYALHAALDATLRPGAEAFADETGLSRALAQSSAVVLGEGRLDQSSFDGKVASVVLAQARAQGLPVAALVGQSLPLPPPPAGPDRVFAASEVALPDGPGRLPAFWAACEALWPWLRACADPARPAAPEGRRSR